MLLGIFGDTHFTNRGPENRIDDYWETQKRKLRKALSIFEDRGVDATIENGDFFDTPTVADKVKSEIIQIFYEYGLIFCVFGQHDISGHSKFTLPNSPLAVLEAARIVKVLDEKPWQIGNQNSSFLYGASFGEKVPKPEDPDAYNVLVTHRMIGDKVLWPGQVLTGPRQFLRKNSAYNLIVCLTGDTKVSLLRGDEVSVKDLIGRKEFYVYSYDHQTNSIVPGRAHSCRKTKQNVPILKITLDNGEVIRCDHNERFLLRNKLYKTAQKLCVGDSLMPLYRRLNEAGYEELQQPVGDWEKTHRVSYKWKYGFNKKKPVTHHKDYDKLNNSPTNILAMSWYGHFDFHSKHHKEMWKNPKYRKRAIAAIREGCKKRSSDPIRRKKWVDNLSKAHLKLWTPSYRKAQKKVHKVVQSRPDIRQKYCEANRRRVQDGTHIFITNNPNIERRKKGSLQKQVDKIAHDPRINKIRAGVMRDLAKEGNHPSQIRMKEGTHNFLTNHPMKSDAGKERMIRSRIKKVLDILKSKNLDITEENWNNNRPHQNTPLFETAQVYFEILVNHKIVSIEDDGFEDVYSFEVDKHANFALSAGVFVHNCGDYHYRFQETWNDRTILNPGALVRKTRGEFDLAHVPAVMIFDTETNEVEVIELGAEPVEEVFDFTNKKPEKKDNKVLVELVEKLRIGGKKLSGWKHFLVRVFEERNSRQKIRDIIDERLDRVRNGGN